MKKHYLSPFAGSVILNPRSILMTSTNGDLGDLGEITIITDSIVDQDMFDGLIF